MKSTKVHENTRRDRRGDPLWSPFFLRYKVKYLIAIALCGILCVPILITACSAPPDGKTVFIESGCARCHEINGSGSSQAPRLEGLQSKWTPESLEEFLIDPPAYAKDNARLLTYQKKYPTPMPRLEIAPARRKILVQYLLKRYP